MSICLVCGLADHGECRCDEYQSEFDFKRGYRKGIEDAAKVAQKICNTQNGADVQFMIPKAIRALLKDRETP